MPIGVGGDRMLKTETWYAISTRKKPVSRFNSNLTGCCDVVSIEFIARVSSVAEQISSESNLSDWLKLQRGLL